MVFLGQRDMNSTFGPPPNFRGFNGGNNFYERVRAWFYMPSHLSILRSKEMMPVVLPINAVMKRLCHSIDDIFFWGRSVSPFSQTSMMALFTSNPALVEVQEKAVPLMDWSISGVVFLTSCCSRLSNQPWYMLQWTASRQATRVRTNNSQASLGTQSSF